MSSTPPVPPLPPGGTKPPEPPAAIVLHSGIVATREGRIGVKTSTGYVIDTVVPFVALPSTGARHRFVWIRNPATKRTAIAVVLDVGPWNEHDDPYVFGGARPAAESGIDSFGRPTNGAGIDLGEFIWYALGMRDNSKVDWKFLEVVE